MDTWKEDRIGSALEGTNPTVLARLESGFAVFGDTQFLPGYCVLLAYPQVASLDDLPPEGRATFLRDMTRIGDAIREVAQPLRLNYEILGNDLPFLHAHIYPRYTWEPDLRRRRPVWQYAREKWTNPCYRFDRPEYAQLMASMRAALQRPER